MISLDGLFSFPLCIFIIAIINSEEHIAELSSWIDRKSTTYSLSNIVSSRNFLGNVVVAKVAGADEIIGGYNLVAWGNSTVRNTFVETNDSFIFSLKMEILKFNTQQSS
ncbi:hypothetical protein Glove_52g94 [Diversispora epigaea]|uniref:TLDc domain-containing protein n=1 Tax=Diversispora epigaea TaxID=1348612 RepID=A0A397JGI0_9GLOM|nr:hypothetical protein Glove_52g94 [Diversispora epigaea]